jgi:hypothetical protein
VSQVSFRLVNVVDALATPTRVLRVERVDTVSSRPNAKDERVLSASKTSVSSGEIDVTPSTGSVTGTRLGPDPRFVFGIPLDGEMQDRLLVFMLQQPVDDQRVLRIPCLDERTRDVPDSKLYAGSDLSKDANAVRRGVSHRSDRLDQPLRPTSTPSSRPASSALLRVLS